MTPLNPAITYEHALTLVFDTGTVPDGYSGDRASVSFAYEPHSKMVSCCAPWLYQAKAIAIMPSTLIEIVNACRIRVMLINFYSPV